MPGGLTKHRILLLTMACSREILQEDCNNRRPGLFYGLGLVSPHYDFSPNLNSWNRSGDPSVQESLPTNINGDTLPGFKGNGSGNLVIPNEPVNDRGDIPKPALPYQLVKSPYDLKRTIHAYEGEVSQMDTQLGLVLDKMDSLDLWSNTIVIFFSDHGQHLGEHEGLWRKQTLFEEALHIPLVVCAPGKAPGVCNRLVELIDIYPTLLELCKLPRCLALRAQVLPPYWITRTSHGKTRFCAGKRSTIMGGASPPMPIVIIPGKVEMERNCTIVRMTLKSIQTL